MPAVSTDPLMVASLAAATGRVVLQDEIKKETKNTVIQDREVLMGRSEKLNAVC